MKDYTPISKNFLQFNQDKINNLDLNKTFYLNKNHYIQSFIPFEKKYPFKYIKILQSVSYRCSAKCPYCMNAGWDYAKNEKPVEDYIAFYQKIIDYGYRIRLEFTGGEPLQPDVIDRTIKLMDYAFSQDAIYEIRLNTNGAWPIPESWSNNPKLMLSISLDGNAELMEQETQIPGIFDKVIKSFDFCKEHNIKFRIRAVMTDETEKFYTYLIDIAKKYDVVLNIGYAYPVGRACDTYKNINEKLQILEKYRMIREKQKELNYYKIQLYTPVAKCHKRLNPNILKILITPDGNIGLCAFLMTKYQHKYYNIYNLNPNDFPKLREDFINDLQDRTCFFPEGFLTFWNSLTEEQKEQLNWYINDPVDKDILPSTKEYYQLGGDKNV